MSSASFRDLRFYYGYHGDRFYSVVLIVDIWLAGLMIGVSLCRNIFGNQPWMNSRMTPFKYKLKS